MEALAMYLWHLLSSRDESDSDEEEVELPHVKLPEITVLRKNEEPIVPARPGKRKRVSFAEPLHSNGSATPNANSVKSPNYPADHYTLVPVNSDHDYVRAPLVCYRRLPDGVLVKTPVVVKSIDHLNQTSQNEEPVTSQKSSVSRKQPFSCREALKKTNSTNPFVKDDPAFDRHKTYKPVHEWSELLEQFGAKPEDGDKLFEELISALSDEGKENIGDVEDVTDDDDEECGEANENGDEYNHDSDSDSVEIVWEGDQKEASGSSVLRTLLSDKVPVPNVYRELFDKFAEEYAPAKVASGDSEKPGDSSQQSSNVGERLKDLCEEAVDIEIDGSGRISSVGPLTSADLHGELGVPDHADDQPVETVDTSAETSRVSAVNTNNRGESSKQLSDKPAVYSVSVLQECGSSALPGAAAESCSSAVESGAVVRNTAAIESGLDVKSLCDWALSAWGTPQVVRPSSPKTGESTSRKRPNPSTTTTDNETTGGQPEVRKKRRTKKSIEELSKKQLISRLAKEMRLKQDPRDMMDDSVFKTTFGVSKEFANFLIKSLAPHLSPAETRKLIRASRVSECVKVLAVLHFFATGNTNRDIGRLMHISQPQVSKTISEVVNALVRTAPDPELPTSDSEFHELYGLPGIIGAVDATHIPIRHPSGIGRKCKGKERFEDPFLYKNSANYFSVNVEIVSSSSNRILFCCTKLPGSSTKSVLWRKSKVRELMTERHVESNASLKLIAGAGHDCEPWLLTPCPPCYTNTAEYRYNTALASALQDSARLTIGLLKGRFKCLGMASSQQLLCFTPGKAAQIFTACCVLHNLLMDFGEEMPELAFDQFDLVTSEDSNETNWDGLEARNAYIVEHF